MSRLRLLPLLVIVAVLSLCLPLSAVAQDPTTACYAPVGDSSYGVMAASDSGYYHIVGLNFYASTSHNVLCTYRAFYRNGPGNQHDVYGPWHGNPAQNPDYCTGPYTSTSSNTSDWAEAGNGNVGLRTNGANGKTVITSFSIGRACKFPAFICAGIGCPGSTNYAKEIASLRADPTYRTYNFTLSAGAPDGTTQVISMLNATSWIGTVRPPSGIYNDEVLSVITSVSYCYGYKTLLC